MKLLRFPSYHAEDVVLTERNLRVRGNGSPPTNTSNAIHLFPPVLTCAIGLGDQVRSPQHLASTNTLCMRQHHRRSRLAARHDKATPVLADQIPQIFWRAEAFNKDV